jgi:hypothetical protein
LSSLFFWNTFRKRLPGTSCASVSHSAVPLMNACWLAVLFVAVLSGCTRHAPQAANSDQDIVFAAKSFYNGEPGQGEEIVYVAGALSGAHVGYPNNYTATICFRNHKECVVASIDQIGSHQLSRIDIPDNSKPSCHRVAKSSGQSGKAADPKAGG